MRVYELIESSTKSYSYIVIHGGGKFDKPNIQFLGRGEPGDLRPLGKGLYGYLIRNKSEAAYAIEMAGHYTKYAPWNPKDPSEPFELPEQTIHAFRVTMHPGEVGFRGKIWNEDLLSDDPQIKAVGAAYAKANSLKPGPERSKAFDHAETLRKELPKPNYSFVTELVSEPPLVEIAVLDLSRLQRIGSWPKGTPINKIVKELNI